MEDGMEVEEATMTFTITKEDAVLCSLLQPLPYAKGQLAPGESEKENRSRKKKPATARSKSPPASVPALAKVKPKASTFKVGDFFVWLHDMHSQETRPTIWRVKDGSVALRADLEKREDATTALYSVGTRRGLIPIFEDYKVLRLNWAEGPKEDETDLFRVTFPTAEALETAKKEREYKEAKAKADEESASESAQLNSAIFGSLGKDAASPARRTKKERYAAEMAKVSPSKAPAVEEEATATMTKDPAAIAKENAETLRAQLGDAGPPRSQAEEDAEAFVDAVFAKAILGQVKGDILERTEKMIGDKVEQLEGTIGVKLRHNYVAYSQNTVKELKDTKRRRCAACEKSRSGRMSMFSFSEPAPVARGEAPPKFVCHFVCSDGCQARIQSLLDLTQFKENCFHRAQRRWAVAVAEEAEEEESVRRSKRDLFQLISEEAKLRAGLAKSYHELVKRCQ